MFYFHQGKAVMNKLNNYGPRARRYFEKVPENSRESISDNNGVSFFSGMV